MDEAEVVHLLGGEAVPVRISCSALAKPSLRPRKVSAPMPGKSPNSCSGKPNFVPRSAQSTSNESSDFETAAERVALREADGDEVGAKRRPVAVEDGDAGAAIGQQGVAVAGGDAGREVVEVATEAEDARVARAQHNVLEVIAELSLERDDVRLPAVEILEERWVVGGPALAEIDEGPKRCVRKVAGGFQAGRARATSDRGPRPPQRPA